MLVNKRSELRQDLITHLNSPVAVLDGQVVFLHIIIRYGEVIVDLGGIRIQRLSSLQRRKRLLNLPSLQ